MRKNILVLILLFTGFSAFSQNKNDRNNDIQTIFSRHGGNGGYGAISFGFSQIDGKDAVITGARGAFVMNHSLAIGIGGYGFINDYGYKNYIPGNPANINLAGGYGGIFLEPVLGPRFPVHLSFPALFGIGGVAQVEDPQWSYYASFDGESDVYLVFEPAAELELNLTRFLRTSFYGSYRFTTDIEITGTAPDVLEGWNMGITFKIGKF